MSKKVLQRVIIYKLQMAGCTRGVLYRVVGRKIIGVFGGRTGIGVFQRSREKLVHEPNSSSVTLCFVFTVWLVYNLLNCQIYGLVLVGA